ncbi:ABC transporter ATP-binding protein [Treponema bryantii]|uniref:ABC transporter ATP-binding protein n=1 Tax=Treponema bryantii TaxID=163 RepID=UPI002B2D101C|nr:macrolide ABC transporter ATP-binding protein [Treponema bryantii]
MIKVEKLRKVYKRDAHEVIALNEVSLNINDGDFIALKGPSGSGKSTLLNILGLLDIPDSGKYFLNNINVGVLDAKGRSEFRKRYLGFVFQNYNLIPELNVYENVEIPLLIQGEKKQNIKEKIEFAIENVGLKDYLYHKPGELSGGQQQRVSIARALVRKPPVIIADEPTANLDTENSKQIISLMREMNEKLGTTFVFATHDELILEYMKQIAFLRDGNIEKIEVK